MITARDFSLSLLPAPHADERRRAPKSGELKSRSYQDANEIGFRAYHGVLGSLTKAVKLAGNGLH